VSFVVETEIARPPEEVFDRMADARNEPSWNSQVSRSELLSGEPIGSGSRFVTVNRGKEYAATISTYERPGALGFDVSGAPMDITAAFRLRPSGAGTVMTAEWDMRPKGAFRFVFPLMGPVIRKDLNRQTARFKAFCEGG
jgi:Polyketide cyclase / dehydrase and lipid transport